MKKSIFRTVNGKLETVIPENEIAKLDFMIREFNRQQDMFRMRVEPAGQILKDLKDLEALEKNHD